MKTLFALALSLVAIAATAQTPIVQTFTVNGVSFDMVAVRGGTFWRGAQNIDDTFSNYDPNAADNEMPMRKYVVSDFWIGKYPVTQDLWFAIMGMAPNNDVMYEIAGEPYGQWWSNYPNWVGDDFPAFYISYTDMKKFVAKLGELLGYKYTFDMPTEAQWEYAARGGIYNEEDYIYAGSNNYDDVAWTSENSGQNQDLHRVGLKKPNQLGLYDMCGGVGEWCKDAYSSETPEPKYDDYCYTVGTTNVLRGGRFARPAVHNRIATRYNADKDERMIVYGGRLVIRRGLPIPEEPTEPEEPITPQPDPTDPTAVAGLSQSPLAVVRHSSSDEVRIIGAEAAIMVFDAMGRLVLNTEATSGEISINVSSLPRGLYIVRSGSASVRFVR